MMWLSFFICLLLLVSIGGIFRPATQCFFHFFLTICCLMVGIGNALDPMIAKACIILGIVAAASLCYLLKNQRLSKNSKELIFALTFVVVIIYLMICVFPPSIQRLEYGVALSIILVGMVYSLLGKTVGTQIMGITCALNALLLIVGLNGQGTAFLTLVIIYCVFLACSNVVVYKIGRVF